MMSILNSDVFWKNPEVTKFSMININGIAMMPLVKVEYNRNVAALLCILGAIKKSRSINLMSFRKYTRAAIPEPKCITKDIENECEAVLSKKIIPEAVTSPSELRGNH